MIRNPDALPTAEEINVYDSLDERVAVRNFLGKSLLEAEELFRENPWKFSENLMFMGPRAFCFYVRAYANYMRSDSAAYGSDLRVFLMTVQFRVEEELEHIRESVPVIQNVVQDILERFEKFEIDLDFEPDRELHEKYVAFHKQLALLADAR